MSDEDQHPIIRADDLAAALTAFAIEFAAAMNSPENKTPNESLRALAAQLATMAGRMSDTPAAAAAMIAISDAVHAHVNATFTLLASVLTGIQGGRVATRSAVEEAFSVA